MATEIIKIKNTDWVSDSREVINSNFENLNAGKQEIIAGKSLSTHDFTDSYKTKLENLSPNYSLTAVLNDSSNVQATLDYVKSQGGGLVYLQPGTYTLTSDLIIPGGVRLEGTSRDNVIIECGDYSVRIEGTDRYNEGTIGILNNTTTLTGSGTNWDSSVVGKYVLLHDYFYEVVSLTSSTELEIGVPFKGDTIAPGNAYYIINPVFNAQISKVTIQNSTVDGLVINGTFETGLDDIYVVGCAGVGINITNSVYPYIILTSNENGVNLEMNRVFGFRIDWSAFETSTTGPSVKMYYCGNATFFDSGITNGFTNGLELDQCFDIVFISMNSENSNSNGVYLLNNKELVFNSFTARSNTLDGFNFIGGNNRCTVTVSKITDNGNYGINIVDNTNIACQDIANMYNNNTSGSILNNGTTTKIL